MWKKYVPFVVILIVGAVISAMIDRGIGISITGWEWHVHDSYHIVLGIALGVSLERTLR